jgi:hypothetical protein
MPEALIRGYSNFRALDCSADIGWQLFSYELPVGFDAGAALQTLRNQIEPTVPMFAQDAGASSCWSVVKQDAQELQLQCRTVTYGSPGYDEWRFRVDRDRRTVTAMFSNLDSEVEREAYPELLAAFEKACAR